MFLIEYQIVLELAKTNICQCLQSIDLAFLCNGFEHKLSWYIIWSGAVLLFFITLVPLKCQTKIHPNPIYSRYMYTTKMAVIFDWTLDNTHKHTRAVLMTGTEKPMWKCGHLTVWNATISCDAIKLNVHTCKRINSNEYRTRLSLKTTWKSDTALFEWFARRERAAKSASGIDKDGSTGRGEKKMVELADKKKCKKCSGQQRRIYG